MSMLDSQDQEPKIADPQQEADIESSEAEEMDTLDILDADVSGIPVPLAEPVEVFAEVRRWKDGFH